MSDESETRRTQGVHAGPRAQKVIERVLHATNEEIARAGYAGLRVEDVAARSGVNKTTIYRRWPTKLELVKAACESVMKLPELHDTGDVREDLLGAIRTFLAFKRTATGKGLVRVMQTEGANPEVAGLSAKIRKRQRASWTVIIERAIARKQLPQIDPELVIDLVFAPIANRTLYRGESVSDAFVVEVVDTVLAGLHARARRSS